MTRMRILTSEEKDILKYQKRREYKDKLKVQAKEWEKKNLDGWSYKRGVADSFTFFVALAIWMLIFSIFNLWMFMVVSGFSKFLGGS